MNHKKQVAALLGATMLGTSAWAQEIDEIIVLSSPFKKAASKVISTTEVLTSEEIEGSISGPLGNLLDSLPGVSSAGYGPAVGQPVIRGVGGYRVDVMQNGMTIGDISSTSGDHTNTMSLFETEQVEVLKGPAALRYGAYAATGVVNGFNRHLNADTEEGTDVLVGFGDNADETITGIFTRQGQFSLSAFSQDADNITIPTHGESEAYHEREEAEAGDDGDDDHELVDGEQEAANTERENFGFTAAGHFGDDETKLSVMFSSSEIDYLIPHEHSDHEGHEGDDDDNGHAGDDEDDDHHEEAGGADISLEQQTFHARLAHNGAVGPFNSFRADLTSTAFEQTETVEEEDGIERSEFEQDSLHLRGEFTGIFNDWNTLVGLEYRDIDLTAPDHEHGDEDGGNDDGEEEHGYLPNTESTQYGLFVFAEHESNEWLTEAAIRFDEVELEAAHEEEDEQDDDHDHEGPVSFTLTNISVGLAKKLDDNLLVGGSVSSTERAPSQVELFANGEHHAVGRTEIGDEELDKESSLSTELYIRKAWQNSQMRVAIFNNDYSDFVFLEETDTHGTFNFVQADAELYGYELDYQTDLTLGGRLWNASLSYSSVTGELSDGDNLPAIPADKFGFGIGTSFNAFDVKLDVEQVADQDDTGEEELATDGYTSVDISASYQPPAYEGLTLNASIRNLTDEEIRQHTSPLKDKLPEAGQDIRLTARYKF